MWIFRRRRWPRGDWFALGEAFVVLAIVRLALATMNFKRIERIVVGLIRRIAPTPVDGTAADDARLGRAVRRAAVLVPGAKCLAQATAAMLLSARYNRRSRMTIGVKLGASEAFGAHAWLETPHGIPVGGAEAAQFAPLLSVDPYASTQRPTAAVAS
ncbi:MAG TPA: lasso peptide biosynthesis B2 protein [Gemmatimonadaceae bacterium]|nr:lasso peptide biosynthesis B2 protein [Gemmatimonadaceae bacterium]